MKAVLFWRIFFLPGKRERAVFRQILAEDPLEVQSCYLKPKMVHVEAKTDNGEVKSGYVDVKSCKMKAVFFDKFFMWLKGKRNVFRQILPGDFLEA